MVVRRVCRPLGAHRPASDHDHLPPTAIVGPRRRRATCDSKLAPLWLQIGSHRIKWAHPSGSGINYAARTAP